MQHYTEHFACLNQNCYDPCGGGGACSACMAKNCPLEEGKCEANGDCFLLTRCIQDCAKNDLNCTQACYAKYPPAAQKLIADETACGKANCQPQCL